MAVRIETENGGVIEISACLHCGGEAPDAAICSECLACPRCGSLFTHVNLVGDPLLLRCHCCLLGWSLEVRTIQGLIAERAEEEMAFFARDPSAAFDRAGEGAG